MKIGNYTQYNNKRCLILDIEHEPISTYKLLDAVSMDIYYTTAANLSPISESNRHFIKPVTEMSDKQKEFLEKTQEQSGAEFNGTDMLDLKVFLDIFGKIK